MMNDEYTAVNDYRSYIAHFGILGMKWGVRRYQNADGSLTDAGRKHYATNSISIPSGSSVFRATATNSADFLKRKYTYVNITDDYSEHNINTSDGFEGRFNYDYVMKTKRKLKIASLNQYYNALNEYCKIDELIKNSINISNEDKQRGKKIVQKYLDHKYKEGDGGYQPYMNAVVDILNKRGYDGVIDPIDGAHQDKYGEQVMAMILFYPEDKIEIKGVMQR